MTTKLPISKKSKSLNFLTPNFNTKLVIPVHSQKKISKKAWERKPEKIQQKYFMRAVCGVDPNRQTRVFKKGVKVASRRN